MSDNLLEINNLYLNAEEKEILKGINLKIKPGEIHVIMGPNGSGKTTTMISKIIHLIANEKIELKRLLIVTYTNAAASEMKQKLYKALTKKIGEIDDPKKKYIFDFKLLYGWNWYFIKSRCCNK